MMNGQTDNVKIFMQEIQSLVYNHIIHEDNLVKLLQTKSANETPGLYISMLYGFDEIIDIFLNALTHSNSTRTFKQKNGDGYFSHENT